MQTSNHSYRKFLRVFVFFRKYLPTMLKNRHKHLPTFWHGFPKFNDYRNFLTLRKVWNILAIFNPKLSIFATVCVIFTTFPDVWWFFKLGRTNVLCALSPLPLMVTSSCSGICLEVSMESTKSPIIQLMQRHFRPIVATVRSPGGKYIACARCYSHNKELRLRRTHEQLT